MTTTIYTDEQIQQAVTDYAIHHEVEADAVLVERSYTDGRLTGFRLSLDADGKSRGCDERYGEF